MDSITNPSLDQPSRNPTCLADPLAHPRINMVASTMMNKDTSVLVISLLPATKALEHSKHRRLMAREGRRGSLQGNNLANELFTLTLDQESEAFPSIEWDSGNESDADSVPSTESWSSFFSTSDSTTSLGKRSSTHSRRLVRSKKIKSNLSSLGLGLSA